MGSTMIPRCLRRGSSLCEFTNVGIVDYVKYSGLVQKFLKKFGQTDRNIYTRAFGEEYYIYKSTTA